MDGAAELFSELGYYGASLRNISRRVGISHPGMLHHFSTKEDLLGGVIERLENRAQVALDNMDAYCVDAAAFRRALGEQWDPVSPEIQLLATLDAEIVSEDHPGRFRIARLCRVHEHILAHCFTTLSAHGCLREDVDPTFASRAMVALVLRDAVRERTVRRMQRGGHEDAPQDDLCSLLGTFLKH